ncbi:hypothetical protein B7P43_G09141 [Cryptotermes secundus]|uniref:Uncharacterized protein n=1 Tax=Cryptotermes secundus TaxID=105785 RepID=A0A2J7Q3E7_9NEOP|nr:hypothetical protein B7P43_G09141 [Cryptotermes secundus]
MKADVIGGACGMHGRDDKCIKNSSLLLRRLRQRWEDNVLFRICRPLPGYGFMERINMNEC